MSTAAAVDLAKARRLERATLLSVPAEKEWEVGGWVCRWGARGLVGRVASACVSPFVHEDQPLAPVREVAACYAALGLPALLRITPLTPEGVVRDPELRPVRSVTLVMSRPLDEAFEVDGRVELGRALTPAWTEAFLAPYDAVEGHARLSLAEAAPSRRRFAVLHADGGVAGIALGVVSEGAIGVFDVLTLPEHRRRGVAAAVVSALLAWGRAEGADVAYLQVTVANAPAIALYERLGFATAYTYTYASLVPSPT